MYTRMFISIYTRIVQKGIIKKDSPKTLGTRVSCETGTGLVDKEQDRHRARQA